MLFGQKNRGKLDKKYKKFEIEVEASSGESTIVKVKASDKKFKAGRAAINLAGGDTTLYVTWTNDHYKAGKYDANIEIKQIRLKKVGEYEGSPLTAYLLGTNTGNKILLVTILSMLLAVIAAISFYNKRQTEKVKM